MTRRPRRAIVVGMHAVPIRLVLAQREGLARAGLRALLDREPDLAVAGEASRGEEAITLAAELGPHVVVLDSDLPGLDPLEATRAVRDLGAQVLVIGAAESDAELFGALQAGAGAFLARDAEPLELLRAVRSLAAGLALLSPRATRRLIDELAARPDPHRPVPERLEELTAREREVMTLVALGLTNAEIAERLVVSPATAKTHVSRAMLKLHARHRAQLVTLAYQARLVEARPASPLSLAA